MELLDNTNLLFGDGLRQTLRPGARLKVAASCFSMYAFEALRAELEHIEELQFLFTAPTFVADEVSDKIRKERKEFHIPKLDRERSLYGSEFEVQLRNQLTQRAIARECAEWLQRKARFKSTPDALDKSNLDLFVDNIRPDRTAEDLLFQVMLDWGVDLALPIARDTIRRKEVLRVDGNALVACFDAAGGADEALVKDLARLQPLRVVFRDAGFRDSAMKINVEQIFRQRSPGTEVKCL